MSEPAWCDGSHASEYDKPPLPHLARGSESLRSALARYGQCRQCGRTLRLVGGRVVAGWGRTRLPRHKKAF